MYERSLILKLNNYGYNDKQIEEVKDFLKDRNQIPGHLDTNAKMKRFYDKWSQFMFITVKFVLDTKLDKHLLIGYNLWRHLSRFQ